jgi:hypothetical protein
MVHDRLYHWDMSVLFGQKRKLKNAKNEIQELSRSELTEEKLTRDKELMVDLKKFSCKMKFIVRKGVV